MTLIKDKYRLPEYGLSITNGPRMSDLTQSLGKEIEFTVDVKNVGHKCRCRLEVLGFQDALGNLLDIPESFEDSEEILVFGQVIILRDKDNLPQRRSFEYYNPEKKKGELLSFGGKVILKGSKKKK